jgi:mannose-6-phosphate isomerase-like protein (cupin superfamily)
MTAYTIRRVVTGVTSGGKSVVIEDGSPPRSVDFDSDTGYKLFMVWGTDNIPHVPTDGHDSTPAMESFAPGPGGSRFLLSRWPPGAETITMSAAELASKMPGIAETVENEDPQMHTTDSIDYGFVLSGEMWLELDDGAQVHLSAGDCVIQNGTRHAWRNRGTEPCVMAFVMIGAHRSPSASTSQAR